MARYVINSFRATDESVLLGVASYEAFKWDVDQGRSGADARTDGWVVAHKDGRIEYTPEFFQGNRVPGSIMERLARLASCSFSYSEADLRKIYFGYMLDSEFHTGI